ncbi:MAG: hypothetical protein ACTSVA_00990 [Candidatus Njordarchaeales archaeon]
MPENFVIPHHQLTYYFSSSGGHGYYCYGVDEGYINLTSESSLTLREKLLRIHQNDFKSDLMAGIPLWVKYFFYPPLPLGIRTGIMLLESIDLILRRSDSTKKTEEGI